MEGSHVALGQILTSDTYNNAAGVFERLLPCHSKSVSTKTSSSTGLPHIDTKDTNRRLQTPNECQELKSSILTGMNVLSKQTGLHSNVLRTLEMLGTKLFGWHSRL